MTRQTLDLLNSLRHPDASHVDEVFGPDFRDLLLERITATAPAHGLERSGAYVEGLPIPTRRPTHPIPARSRRAVRRSAGATVGVAAAVVVAVVVSAAPYPSPNKTGSRALQTPSSTTTGVGELTAAKFLHRAAQAVLDEVSTVPQPGQFVYSERKESTGTVIEFWKSADGTQSGIEVSSTSASGTHALSTCTYAKAEAGSCLSNAGYYAGLPTQSGAVLPYLEAMHIVTEATFNSSPGATKGITETSWHANTLGKTISSMLFSVYLAPAQKAAIYNLLAGTPGFTLAKGIVDSDGQSGVGIEWRYQGDTSALVFNPTTYAFLGIRTWGATVSLATPSAGYGATLIAMSNVNQIPPSIKASKSPAPVLVNP